MQGGYGSIDLFEWSTESFKKRKIHLGCEKSRFLIDAGLLYAPKILFEDQSSLSVFAANDLLVALML